MKNSLQSNSQSLDYLRGLMEYILLSGSTSNMLFDPSPSPQAVLFMSIKNLTLKAIYILYQIFLQRVSHKKDDEECQISQFYRELI